MRSVAGPQPHHEQNPVQKCGTTGIKPMGRPTIVTRCFMRIVSWSERLNLAFSTVGNPPIYDNAVFPWTCLIEKEWCPIRAELERVLTRKDELPGFHELATDVSTISRDHGWKSFILLFVDFRKPLRFPASLFNWLLLHLAVFTPFIREAWTTRRHGKRSSTPRHKRCGMASLPLFP